MRLTAKAHLWWNVLNLLSGTREHSLEHLARDWPEQLDRYERLYARSAYLRGPQTAELDVTMSELRSEWVWAPRGLRRSGRASWSCRSRVEGGTGLRFGPTRRRPLPKTDLAAIRMLAVGPNA